jgi:hypothetical protein
VVAPCLALAVFGVTRSVQKVPSTSVRPSRATRRSRASSARSLPPPSPVKIVLALLSAGALLFVVAPCLALAGLKATRLALREPSTSARPSRSTWRLPPSSARPLPHPPQVKMRPLGCDQGALTAVIAPCLALAGCAIMGLVIREPSTSARPSRSTWRSSRSSARPLFPHPSQDALASLSVGAANSLWLLLVLPSQASR